MEQLGNKVLEEAVESELLAQCGQLQEKDNEAIRDYDSLECKIQRLKDDIEALKRIKHQQKKLEKLEEKKLEILMEIENARGRESRHKHKGKRSSKH